MASKSYHYSQITLTTICIVIVFSNSDSVFDVARGTQIQMGGGSGGGFTKIYAFGDSFTDTGNTRSETGPNGFNHVSQPPYGMTYFHRPTNRYSDGRLVIDFVAETLSLPYVTPYMNIRTADTSHGVNFAVGGSTAIEHSFFVNQNITLDLVPESIGTQLVWFKKFLESRGCKGNGNGNGNGNNSKLMSKYCRVLMDDALFWVGEIGVNDYAYIIGSSVSTSTIQQLAIKRVTSFLQALLEMGAKYIIVEGLPTTGCLPLAMTLAPTDDRDEIGCVGSADKTTYAHNTHLQSNIEALRRNYPQSIISYADYWNAYRTVMKNPTAHGFKQPFKACCGFGGGAYNFDLFTPCGSPSVSTACLNPSQYINWDGVHLTEAMYKVIADMFIRGGMCHPSFDVLLSSKTRGGG